MPFTPDVKQPGDLARAQDWNEAMSEVVRLENAKVDKTGDTMTGRLTINGGGDVEPGSGGYLVLGSASGVNIALDNNEIMARNNGQTAPLHLQVDGGDLIVHNSRTDAQKVIVTDAGLVGIGTATPETKLHVVGNVLSTGYGAKTICHRLMTAPWLNENAAFGNARSHALNNNRLDIGAGSASWEKLFSVPLVPANTLSANRTYAVRIAVSATNLTSDNDLTIGLSDGTNVVGFLRRDGGNNIIGTTIAGTDGNTLGSRATGPEGGASNVTHKSFEIQMRLAADTWVLGKVNSEIEPSAWTAPRTILRENTLSLVAFGENAGEQYGIYAVEVSIMHESPIPITFIFGELLGVLEPIFVNP